MARILSIAPNREVMEAHCRAMAQSGHEVHGVATRIAALDRARSGGFEIALLCGGLPPGYADQLAAELRSLMPATIVFLLPEDAAPSQIEKLIRDTLRLKAA
jgi:DNA-binding response OmpR family regulator